MSHDPTCDQSKPSKTYHLRLDKIWIDLRIFEENIDDYLDESLKLALQADFPAFG
jgi:hypothetical protein